MKYNILCILMGMLIFSVVPIKSQTNNIGLCFGIDLARSYYTNMPEKPDGLPSFDPMVTFNLNVHLEYRAIENYGFSVEPGYIQKGFVGGNNYRFNLNYIQLPLFIDFYPAKRFSISVGPEFAYLMNKNRDFFDRKMEIAGIAGIGMKVNNNIELGLRYDHGFTPLMKTAWEDLDGHVEDKSSKFYNQYFQLIVRYNLKS